MPAPPLKTEISDNYPNPSNAVARGGFGKLYDYVVGLLGGTGDAAEARTALGVPSAMDAELAGNPTATTQPDTDNSSRIATTAWVRNALTTLASAAGFAVSLTTVGYIKLPTWLGSWVCQWGTSVVTFGGGLASTSFAMAFPSQKLMQLAMNGDGGNNPGGIISIHTGSSWDSSKTGIAVRCTQSTTGNAVPDGTVMRINFIAIGN